LPASKPSIFLMYSNSLGFDRQDQRVQRQSKGRAQARLEIAIARSLKNPTPPLLPPLPTRQINPSKRARRQEVVKRHSQAATLMPHLYPCHILWLPTTPTAAILFLSVRQMSIPIIDTDSDTLHASRTRYFNTCSIERAPTRFYQECDSAEKI